MEVYHSLSTLVDILTIIVLVAQSSTLRGEEYCAPYPWPLNKPSKMWSKTHSLAYHTAKEVIQVDVRVYTKYLMLPTC